MRKLILIIYVLLCCWGLVSAQVNVHGNIEHSGLFGVDDKSLGAVYDFPYLNNTYLSVGLDSKYIFAGVRIEAMPKPLQGYDAQFAGAGVGNIFVEGKYKWLDITIGDVYAQYGSGLVMRLYEDRALGVDNSLRGGKIVVEPYKGIHIEAIGGKQRVYWNCYNSAWGWDYTKGAVVGSNMELQIDQWSQKMTDNNIRLMVGASYVSKYDPKDTVYASYNPPMIYNLPEWTAAGEVRSKLQIKNWSVLVEYAFRAGDPSADNMFSYRHGEALLLSASYSIKGMSVLTQIKRSENMSFRSDRMLRGTAGMISYLPAFTTTHTYSLASLYPYATNMNGEWAWQAEARYTWKKNTLMGGKYGTTLHLNLTHVRGLGNQWFKVSNDPYYTDIHLNLSKRLHKNWWINAMYMYQTYNQTIVEGHGDLIRSHIFVADVKYKINDNITMRAEAQYLYSHHNDHWIYGLLELSFLKCLTLSAADMYNIDGENYWQAGVAFQMKGHRLQAGFARQRAGYNCQGGVCRYVPAQKGATLNYTYSF
ncbi:MAG: hypothetical protein IJ834_03315 [Paludibacteraceae bacterium]|nr:hypothetical protein [Paludibacteraceae bacterium]